MDTLVTFDDLNDRGKTIGLINQSQKSEPAVIIQKTPVINVPHAEIIPAKLIPGQVISIVGTIKSKADRFAVNLTCGAPREGDIAFHLNPRFASGYVVRNSYICKSWGAEEVVAYQRNPFHQGELFFLLILATEDCFMVSVNSKPFCSFNYRTNIGLVNALTIEGDLTLANIEHRHIDIYPEPCPIKLDVFETVHSLSRIKPRPLELPLILQLPQAFTEGQEIKICGQMKLLPIAFFINLQSGCQFWPHPQITLHVNPRFLTVGGSNVICNSWLCGEWGNEEANQVHYFRPGRSFTVNIKCEKNAYILRVDGCPVASYKHRVRPELANTVYVQGDIFLHDVTIVS